MSSMSTEEFAQQLRRPLYNYTMAMHGDSYFEANSVQGKSAATRRKNALAEIHVLALEYVKSGGAPESFLRKLER